MQGIILKFTPFSEQLHAKYNRFCEHRADIKGAYGTKCWCCVTLWSRGRTTRETRTEHIAKAEQVLHHLEISNDQQKVTALLNFIGKHSPQALDAINALPAEEKTATAKQFFNLTQSTVAKTTEELITKWNTYLQRDGYDVIAGYLLKENSVCDYHEKRRLEDSEFEQEMVAAKPRIMTALEDYYTQQDKTLYNRGKKAAIRSLAALSATKNGISRACRNVMKKAAQPRP